jgi:hypothetical protein
MVNGFLMNKKALYAYDAYAGEKINGKILTGNNKPGKG